jgi:hypothetical protein
MKKDYLKQIKDAIRDFKDNREWAESKAKEIEQRYLEQIAEYNTNSWIDKSIIERLTKDMNTSIYNNYEMFGNDASIHIIYEDGSECSTTGMEIVTGECTPKMQHIVYASYMDGYSEFDTETGELNYDVSEDDQQEAREEYFNNIEIKFNTAWGIKHQ